ncbi:1-acyl-sn-glycerol-3-phosphate acyltransferase [Roseobacter sp. HKCCA0434]|uniref:1-acyl-sn-glycerol-3-phosphate acyltransferase n=1 Tax=Roseobacter sp. HKCCA0434 TaxID=3079297 RepID=UPI002905D87D|nr:1-acyl-sn-glycerol-3-phosphate acyltransferase [Roseobacter sp. HKCCA0434]
MKEKLDTLIEERAGWMYRGGPLVRPVRGLLHLMLSYDRTVEIGTELEHRPTHEVMDHMADLIAHRVEVEGLENVPATGPAIIVCNHPTGIADGIVMYSLLREKRPDLFFFANGDILRIMPQFISMIAPVEWREDKRSMKKNRETLTYAKGAFAEDRLAVIFPAGRLSKRRGMRLHERPWMPSAAMLARKYKLPVIPMRITARNSLLFYAFDKMHATLRDITLFHEVLNKDRQRFHVRVGAPILGGELPADTEVATQVLFDAVEGLRSDRRERDLFLERPRRVRTQPG